MCCVQFRYFLRALKRQAEITAYLKCLKLCEYLLLVNKDLYSNKQVFIRSKYLTIQHWVKKFH